MGKLSHSDRQWKAKWITDGEYVFKEKKISPVPMVFRKSFEISKKVVSAELYSTALGTYVFTINDIRVGEDYFTPGFTSYKYNLQYQKYDVTHLLREDNTILGTVSGGWAVGAFVYSRRNRLFADRQALLAELIITYEDGTKELVATDESWEVSTEGPLRYGDLYDGEEYDARISDESIKYHKAILETLRIAPSISKAIGVPVREHEKFEPISVNKVGDELIYDFGQNFAGIVHFSINGKEGQQIEIKHAEILKEDGSLNTDFLRSAKARILYTARDGQQEYAPNFTYMGFRYVSVSGIDEKEISIYARALYSDVKEIGSFTCSNEMINRLQENIKWGAKSNFVEIPTDCPQRDERMGWTGDIALFAATACFNFDMKDFLKKWLRDMRSEQLSTGGIPNTIPSNGFGFPTTMPPVAVDFWGDASVLVPWAVYQATGDKSVLSENYDMMKKYVKACKNWAGLFSFGKHRYIWHTPSTLHFGDWVAPDVPKMSQWQKRSKWTATASLANTAHLVSKVAGILGNPDDEVYFRNIYEKTSDAYTSIFTDGNGKLLEEFQTAYVLPIHFNIFNEAAKEKAAENLAQLVKANDYKIGTGFPGTPYILFALADNGQKEAAFKMLMNTDCPSWLYEVKMGATTIWERWDGLDENGNCPIGDDGTDTMISYNHYASGAVGDFLYRRIAGIEPVVAGYRKFRIAPLVGGGLTFARGELNSPYGKIVSDWSISENRFIIKITVPEDTTCHLIMPDESEKFLSAGEYSFECNIYC
ncbi:alpha-L-rhamnosidase [Pseudobutyrivibrio xylanivorans]|uniref:alpha-L-rhamnosidase n=1 Tax=Pseudobutyrivibrio xylanivorans DSM 14809 TaxID=1123012 RepID=A0A1M6KG12_PSEXY|nr:alpha-L-rhamnosidase [Pseudobutyrivibrio xylanivorans]SHJ57905.1 alpha-L-rhamnosidase [Pseudobutyrivibrio xylanivorans DSM 14809]